MPTFKFPIPVTVVVVGGSHKFGPLQPVEINAAQELGTTGHQVLRIEAPGKYMAFTLCCHMKHYRRTSVHYDQVGRFRIAHTAGAFLGVMHDAMRRSVDNTWEIAVVWCNKDAQGDPPLGNIHFPNGKVYPVTMRLIAENGFRIGKYVPPKTAQAGHVPPAAEPTIISGPTHITVNVTKQGIKEPWTKARGDEALRLVQVAIMHAWGFESEALMEMGISDTAFDKIMRWKPEPGWNPNKPETP